MKLGFLEFILLKNYFNNAMFSWWKNILRCEWSFILFTIFSWQAADYLEQAEYDTGNTDDDLKTQSLMRQLLYNHKLRAACPVPFDEAKLWKGENGPELKQQIQKQFKNIRSFSNPYLRAYFVISPEIFPLPNWRKIIFLCRFAKIYFNCYLKMFFTSIFEINNIHLLKRNGEEGRYFIWYQSKKILSDIMKYLFVI